MRLSVTPSGQNALFGEGVDADCAFSHLGKRGVASRKDALWVAASRKGALCVRSLTKKRTLGMLAHA